MDVPDFIHVSSCCCDACKNERRVRRIQEQRMKFLRQLRKEGKLVFRTGDGAFLMPT